MTAATFSRIFVKTCVVTSLSFGAAFLGIMAATLWTEDPIASALCFLIGVTVIPFLAYQTVMAK